MENSKTKENIFYTLPTEKDFLEIILSDYDENDPRSVYYKRTHVIPEINWRQSLYHMIYPLLLGISLSIVVYYVFACIIPSYALKISYMLSFTGIFVYVLIRAKAIVIWAIKVYQHFAPIKIRNKCRFEPSCSSYMIQAIEKYGVIRGIFQGINRLRRCNISNGGYDYL